MVEPSDRKRTPRDLLRIIFRRWRCFVFSAAGVAFVVLVAAHWLPLKYTGETIFERRTDDAGKATGPRTTESFDTHKMSLIQDLKGRQAVETVVDQLGLTRGPEFTRNERGEFTRAGELAKQQLIERLQKDIQVTWDVQSPEVDRISVRVTHEKPDLAQQLPDELVKSYIDFVSKKITDNLTQSGKFLELRVNDCQKRLRELEGQRIAFETEHRKMMPESPGAIQQRIDQIEANVTALTQQKQTAELRREMAFRKLNELRKEYPQFAGMLYSLTSATTQPATRPTTQPAQQLAAGPAGGAPAEAHLPGPTTRPTSQPHEQPATQPTSAPVEIVMGPNPELDRLHRKLRDLEAALEAARIGGGMKDTHPKVRGLLAQIAQAKELIEKTPVEVIVQKVYAGPGLPRRAPEPTGPDAMAKLAFQNALYDYKLAEQELDTIEANLAPLIKRRVGLDSLLEQFGPKRQQYMELTDKVREQEVELRNWQTQLNRVQMSLAAEVAKKRTHLNAIQAAQERYLPSDPSLIRVMGIAIVGALAFAAGLVYVVNVFDRTISTTDEAIDHFHLPIHGVIGEIITAKQQARRRLKRWFLLAPAHLLITMFVVTAAFSIVLRLRFPDSFSVWKAAPFTFVYNAGSELVGRLL